MLNEIDDNHTARGQSWLQATPPGCCMMACLRAHFMSFPHHQLMSHHLYAWCSALSQQLGPFNQGNLQLHMLPHHDLMPYAVYLQVVIKDILLGTPPHCNGLLCEIFGVANSGPWANPAYIICGVALACAPFLMLKSMDKLSFLNIIGVAATILLAVAAAGLGVTATLQGTAYPVPLTPQWDLLGPTLAARLEALTGVLPVILACYVAHQSLHPLMPLLKPYSPRRMCGVAASALALVACIFLMLSYGGALAFGPELDINALKNFTEDGMAPFVGLELARVLSWAIRGGYLIALLANLLLYMHPLRAYIAEILWPDSINRTADSSQQQGQQGTGCSSTGVTALPTGPGEQATTGGMVHSKCMPLAAQSGVAACTSASESATGSTDGLAVVGDCEELLIETSDAVDTKPIAGEQAIGDIAGLPGALEAAASSQSVSAASASTNEPMKPLLRWQKNEQRWYYPLTYGLLFMLTMLATLVPNIWQALSAIGDLASTMQAFVIPGLIAAVLAADSRLQRRQHVTVDRFDQNDQEVDQDGGALHRSGDPVQEALLHGHHSVVGPVVPMEKHVNSESSFKLRDAADVGWVLYGIMGWSVVVLGSALFANGIWQRI
eukprot:GHUV01025344.1.p1 GENE.GHUV01025344.1~~GHUV01025344.1.p1  ORF type:complete len:609 (+),score=133.44 GHUV01025344.1:956-2782(+)